MKYVERAIMFIAILFRNDCPLRGWSPRCNGNVQNLAWE
jgi:hypothetical protein